MPKVVFTPNLRRHVNTPEVEVSASTVREALECIFAEHRRLCAYIVDEQQRLRKHMVIYVDGLPISDREGLSDPVSLLSEIYVMQALSGG